MCARKAGRVRYVTDAVSVGMCGKGDLVLLKHAPNFYAEVNCYAPSGGALSGEMVIEKRDSDHDAVQLLPEPSVLSPKR